MNLATSVTSIIVGACVFFGAVAALLRGLLRQTESTRDNTRAIRELTRKFEGMEELVREHEIFIQIERGRRRS